jgi:hypothetical protein
MPGRLQLSTCSSSSSCGPGCVVRLRPPIYQQRIAAARCWLQLLEREARLLGLDAPAKIELAAQSAAAEALLQHLADHLPTATMQEVIDALTT